MTIAELEALLREYCPETRAPAPQQGRARAGKPALRLVRYCPICGQQIRACPSKVYCSNACKQKAYRQRQHATGR